MKEELLMKASLLKQESEETEKGLDFVNEQISELEKFLQALDSIKDKNNREILAPLGKGVFMKAKKEDSKLFIEVGDGVVVRKTPEATQKVVEEQIKKFQDARIQLKAQLEEYTSQFSELLKEVEKLKKEKKNRL